MTSLKWCTVFMLLIVFSSGASAESCSLADLRWMAGTWNNKANPEGAQERWALTPQGALMGTAWEFPPGKAGFAEIMTIKQDGERTSMLLRHFEAD